MTQPSRATIKGHGVPTQIIYFGVERTPWSQQGLLLTVVPAGRYGYKLLHEDGTFCGDVAHGTKVWAVPA